MNHTAPQLAMTNLAQPVSDSLPQAPARIFCVGIGGIGVSGLAQLLAHQGYQVAGSDRGLQDRGKEQLYAALRAQGIRLYPQDGSGVIGFQPDALIVSTAVEDGNPDLQANPRIPVIHRARALAQALKRLDIPLVAVAGSCGKTTVTGWIAAALRALGQPIVMVNGGYCLDAETETLPGNFHADEMPKFAVAEVDESDKSIREFHPEYSVLLNVGNDHYGQDELRRVFRDFLSKTEQGIAVLHQLRDLADDSPAAVRTFAPEPAPGACAPTHYTHGPEGIRFTLDGAHQVTSTQFGLHSALNAAAVFTLLRMLPLHLDEAQLAGALHAFQGIRQRFELVGRTPEGIPVINDYAHNPEKVAAALEAARERFGSPILATFQPHGFRPFRFMRETLGKTLAESLRKEDRLAILPVFYAGGTAAFSPTAEEVAEDYQKAGLPVRAMTRQEVERELTQLNTTPACILVMGARDASLRTWASELARL